jgi:hypothetical protein
VRAGDALGDQPQQADLVQRRHGVTVAGEYDSRRVRGQLRIGDGKDAASWVRCGTWGTSRLEPSEETSLMSFPRLVVALGWADPLHHLRHRGSAETADAVATEEGPPS